MIRYFKNKRKKLLIVVLLFSMIGQLLFPLFFIEASAQLNEATITNSRTGTEIKNDIQDYLDSGYGYSKTALVTALIQDGYPENKIIATLDQMNIDFNQQSLIVANQLMMESSRFTREQIIDSLLKEGFSQKEANYAFQELNFNELAIKQARRNMQYGKLPEQNDLINDLQDMGYSHNIASQAVSKAYAEYEEDQKKAFELAEKYLKNTHYSQDKLIEKMTATYSFDYNIVFDLTFDALAIDWKKQALGYAQSLVKEQANISAQELTKALNDAWFRADEIDYAIKNVERDISFEEVELAVSQLEKDSRQEQLVLVEYLLNSLPASAKKDQLLSRVQIIKNKRKQQALILANELVEAMPQSRIYLIESLEQHDFTHEEALYAVDNSKTDWKEQAYRQAQIYLDGTPDSKKGSLDYLTIAWDFTEEEAHYAIDKTKTDWNQQALILANELLTYENYSEKELFKYLRDYHFTKTEAQFASRTALGLDPSISEEDDAILMVTVMDLNLRSQATDIASPTVYLPEGSQLKYLETTKNDWFKLSYKGKTGYTHRGNVTSFENYNSKEDPKIHNAELVEPANHQDFIVVINSNLRTKDAKRYRSIALMPEGSEVTHLGTTANGWFKVRYGDQEGYIHRGDVTSIKNYYSTDTKIHQIALKDKANQQEFISILDQNLRTGNTNHHRSISLINRGDSVIHLGTTANGWFKVKYKGQTGYIYRGDLTSRKNYEKLHE